MLIILCIIADADFLNTPELYDNFQEWQYGTLDPDPPGLTKVSSGPPRPWSSSFPASEAKTTGDKKDAMQESMSQTLSVADMGPTQAPRRRCFTEAEKERINRVRKEGACDQCRKKHRKVCPSLMKGRKRDTY